MKLIVNPHKIEIIKDEAVNEREIDISKCVFEFHEDITNDYVKEAYFTLNNQTYKQIIINNECPFPSEVLETKGMVEIGVVAYLVENEEEIKRYNPSPAYFNTWQGSLKEAKNSEPITPSEMEQYEQALQDGLNSIDEAIQNAENLDIDINKQDNETTITITKQDGTTKSETVLDGAKGDKGEKGDKGDKGDKGEQGEQGIQGIQGVKGDTGAPFTIKKTYSSIAEMNADFDNMELGDYVMIASSVEIEDNAKLYTKGESSWIFITDFSGATGIQGEKGEKGEQGIQGIQGIQGVKGDKGETGETGNGIASVVKTSTSGLIDTYTITYTNGNTSTFNITNGEDGEVTQEQLDKVIKDLEYWKTTNNALPKVEEEDTNITLDNTADSPLSLEFKASENTQNSTTGKNILPNLIESQTISGVQITKNADGSLTLNGTSTSGFNLNINYQSGKYVVLENGQTYKMSLVNNSGLYFRLAKVSDNTIITSFDTPTTNKTFTSNYAGDTYAYFTILNNTTFNNLTIHPMLRLASITDDTYEPYTNGASPNPDYPQDIHVAKGDNEVVIENKNVWDEEKELGSVLANGTNYANSSAWRCINYIPVLPNTTYTLSFKDVTFSTTQGRLIYLDENKVATTGSNNIAIDKNDFTFTTPANCKYIRFFVIIATIPIATKTMLEKGTTATPYTLHEEQNLPLNLGDLEYCKIGDYEDEFYLATASDTELTDGKWYLKKNINKVVLDGTENWSIYNGIQYINSITNYKLSGTICISSHYQAQANVTGTNQVTNDHIAFGNEADNPIFYVKDTRFNNVADFKTWLTNHNVTVYYIKSNSEYILLNETLQTQLDNISYAMAYQDQTNISQINEDRPFIISASTVKDMKTLEDRITTLEQSISL